jgi:deoxyhypusine synthase
MQSMLRTGFQATNMGLAIEQINKMVSSTVWSRNLSMWNLLCCSSNTPHLDCVYTLTPPLVSQLSWRLSDVPVKDSDQEEFKSPDFRAKTGCTIFLSYTSNLISSGIRETIRFLVQHKLVRGVYASMRLSAVHFNYL